MVLERLAQITSHLVSQRQGVDALLAKSPNDIVITLAIRSPMCKAKKGSFKDITTGELLVQMFKHVIARSGVPPAEVQDICIGNVEASGACYQARTAALVSGFPESVPVQVINRFCASGLMAVTAVANQIKSGAIQVGLAVGVESMTENGASAPPAASEDVLAHGPARDCWMPMGWTSEGLASDFSITREDMDAFAAASFQRAEHASDAGYFDTEIVPFEQVTKDSTSGQQLSTAIKQDEGLRRGTTIESLAKIKPVFAQWSPGATTAGNASQVTDGAAAVMLMTRKKAEHLGCMILGKWETTSVIGCTPRINGLGPSLAIPMVLKSVGIVQEDVDLFEINEAFASMMVYTLRALKLDHGKVNVNGGAIALGHPLDKPTPFTHFEIATGLHELRRRRGKILVTSMCAAGGMGAAAVFVAEDE